jgi:hypothetical protein
MRDLEVMSGPYNDPPPSRHSLGDGGSAGAAAIPRRSCHGRVEGAALALGVVLGKRW